MRLGTIQRTPFILRRLFSASNAGRPENAKGEVDPNFMTVLADVALCLPTEGCDRRFLLEGGVSGFSIVPKASRIEENVDENVGIVSYSGASLVSDAVGVEGDSCGITGDITGDITGGITGGITGDVTGGITGGITDVCCGLRGCLCSPGGCKDAVERLDEFCWRSRHISRRLRSS